MLSHEIEQLTKQSGPHPEVDLVRTRLSEIFDNHNLPIEVVHHHLAKVNYLLNHPSFPRIHILFTTIETIEELGAPHPPELMSQLRYLADEISNEELGIRLALERHDFALAHEVFKTVKTQNSQPRLQVIMIPDSVQAALFHPDISRFRDFLKRAYPQDTFSPGQAAGLFVRQLFLQNHPNFPDYRHEYLELSKRHRQGQTVPFYLQFSLTTLIKTIEQDAEKNHLTVTDLDFGLAHKLAAANGY